MSGNATKTPGPGNRDGLEPPREQVVYANLILLGVWVGLFALLVTYGLYVLGVVTPHVPLEKLPSFWRQGVDDYLAATHWPHGWSWTRMVHLGDVLNYVPLVLLALLTVVGYAVLLRAYLRQGDRLYSLFCVLEILVLGLAASGLLGAGGH